MFLASTEAPSECSQLHTTERIHLASCHSQSHDQKTSKTESPVWGLNSLSLTGLHPAGEIEKYG